MGNENSNVTGDHHQSNPNKKDESLMMEEEENFSLEELANISLESKPLYFWVDPKIDSTENKKCEEYLRLSDIFLLKVFNNVADLDSEIQSLEIGVQVRVICPTALDTYDFAQMAENERIKTIFIFCRNRPRSLQRAKDLRTNFGKIKSIKIDIIDLKQAIEEMENDQFHSNDKRNILFMTEEETTDINKYRINFFSLILPHGEENAKHDFTQFAKKFYPKQRKAIEQFEKEFKLKLTQQEKNSQIFSWIQRNNFFFNSTQSLIKATINIKKIGYLRFVFKSIYDAILDSYKKSVKKSGEFYVVLTLNEDQVRKVKEQKNNFIMFTTFVKGFSREKQANEIFKRIENSYLISIMVPPRQKQSKYNIDFGYWMDPKQEKGSDVIFNIYNVFKIDHLDPKRRKLTVEYGCLGGIAEKRDKCREPGGQKLTEEESRLIKNYDYIQYMFSQINSQATIFRMSGYVKESIALCQSKVIQIQKSHHSQHTMDSYSLQMGDLYMMEGDYESARNSYYQIGRDSKLYMRALVHLAELYLKTGESKKMEKTVEEIERNVGYFRENKSVDAFRGINFICLSLMDKGKFKDANKEYKRLISEISEFYNYDHQSIPLVHEIFQNKAICERKLLNFHEALNLIQTVKTNQKYCQGSKSPNLLLTENILRSIFLEKRDEQSVKKTEKQINRIGKSLRPSEIKNVTQSTILPIVKESKIQIETTFVVESNASMHESSINIICPEDSD